MDYINVMLVEDDPVWMDCIKEYLEQYKDIKLVHCTKSYKEAIASYKEQKVTVALIDVMLTPNCCDGFKTACELKKLGLNNIIMLTDLDDKDMVLEAFDNGAINYIKKSLYTDLPNAIRAAQLKQVSIHPDICHILISELKKERKLRYVLTPIERQVYDLREKGMNRNEIAKALFKSEETVKKQIKQIQVKINS